MEKVTGSDITKMNDDMARTLEKVIKNIKQLKDCIKHTNICQDFTIKILK